MAVAKQRLSFEEFLELLEEKPALEYLDGVVTQKMSPKGPHGRLQVLVAMWMDTASGGGRLGWVFTELRTNCVGTASFVPDVAFYRVDRIRTKPSGEVADDFFEPPDLAIEIVSPGQSDPAMLDRARWFIEHRVPLVLILQPSNRSACVLRADSDSGPLQGDAVIDLGDVLPGFSFVVRDLFAALDVPPR